MIVVSDPNPVVGEKDPLTGVYSGHVAGGAILGRRDRARDLLGLGRGVAVETGGGVGRQIGRGAVVGVVAGGATQSAVTLGLAAGLHEPDRLKAREQ